MSAVAPGHVAGMFAGAPGDGLRFGDFDLFGAKGGSFMRAVAKGLGLGSATGAPPIGARLDFLHDGGFLVNNGFGHGENLIKIRIKERK
jgi:hypothetical protein